MIINLCVLYTSSYARDDNPRERFIFCVHDIIIRARDITNHAHDIIIRYHEIIIRLHDIIFRAHEITN